MATIERWIALGTCEFGTCMLCFEDGIPKRNLLQVCGKKCCDAVACSTCLDTWYKAAAPGQICFITNLLCPMCKSKPTTKTLHRHNQELLTLKHIDLATLDRGWYYAWCNTCYTLKQAVEKTCTEEAPVMTNFKCEECIEATATAITTRECPSCTTAINKSSGCNHIHCNCGAHFCYVCRYQAPTSHQIYNHMSARHGGFFVDEQQDNTVILEHEEEYYDSDYSDY